MNIIGQFLEMLPAAYIKNINVCMDLTSSKQVLNSVQSEAAEMAPEYLLWCAVFGVITGIITAIFFIFLDPLENGTEARQENGGRKQPEEHDERFC